VPSFTEADNHYYFYIDYSTSAIVSMNWISGSTYTENFRRTFRAGGEKNANRSLATLIEQRLHEIAEDCKQYEVTISGPLMRNRSPGRRLRRPQFRTFGSAVALSSSTWSLASSANSPPFVSLTRKSRRWIEAEEVP
jgi:hypothetical protein